MTKRRSAVVGGALIVLAAGAALALDVAQRLVLDLVQRLADFEAEGGYGDEYDADTLLWPGAAPDDRARRRFSAPA